LQKDVVLFVPMEASQDFQKFEARDRQTTPQILIAVVEPKVVVILRRTRKEADGSQSFRQKRRKTTAPSHFII
jgi:hypothetical protein